MPSAYHAKPVSSQARIMPSPIMPSAYHATDPIFQRARGRGLVRGGVPSANGGGGGLLPQRFYSSGSAGGAPRSPAESEGELSPWASERIGERMR